MLKNRLGVPQVYISQSLFSGIPKSETVATELNSRLTFYRDLARDCIQKSTRSSRALNLHLGLLRTLMPIEMPIISLVSQPVGRFTDCSR